MSKHISITREQMISAVATLVIVALLVLWLVIARLHVVENADEWPPRHNSTIELEEFVDMAELPESPIATPDEAAEAYAEESVVEESVKAPASGSDKVNTGTVGKEAPTVASKQPSPVKVEQKPDAKQLAAENKRKEEEKIRRQTTSQVSGAFSNMGKHNADNGNADKGNAGSPKGSEAGTATKGRGNGSVSGGWIMPNYAEVASSVTGTVKLVARIDKNGNVTSVTITGGEPPAATNSAVRAACEKEVRAHKFTRPQSAGEATESATAYITYVFK